MVSHHSHRHGTIVQTAWMWKLKKPFYHTCFQTLSFESFFAFHDMQGIYMHTDLHNLWIWYHHHILPPHSSLHIWQEGGLLFQWWGLSFSCGYSAENQNLSQNVRENEHLSNLSTWLMGLVCTASITPSDSWRQGDLWVWIQGDWNPRNEFGPAMFPHSFMVEIYWILIPLRCPLEITLDWESAQVLLAVGPLNFRKMCKYTHQLSVHD